MHRWLAAFALTFALPLSASAALVITEVMPQTTAGSPGTANGDWWELTNNGPLPVNLLGYQWADTEDALGQPPPAIPSPQFFPNFVIGAGQSIIILEENAADETAWLANWGLPAGSVDILSQDEMVDGPEADGDTFSGLGNANDGVFFYDPVGTLLNSYAWVQNTRGRSFETDRYGNNRGLSVIGENGAVLASNGDIGSPGSVPEPTTVLMTLCGAAMALAFRRTR